MKCAFCGEVTHITCRDDQGRLYNCCQSCKNEKGLNVSVCYKGGKETADEVQRAKEDRGRRETKEV